LLGENLPAAPATKKFLADTIAREGRERIWPVVAVVVPTAESTRKAIAQAPLPRNETRPRLAEGLIGSHLADLLVREGCRVRILDVTRRTRISVASRPDQPQRGIYKGIYAIVPR
jgi:hypothetical protein